MQRQQQSNWCWAPVSTSVAVYYDPGTGWSQCGVANGELARTDCCGAGAAGACNVYGTLDTSLSRVGHLSSTAGVASVDNVHGEIDANRPVGLRVAWSGGGAHFLSIIGYVPGGFLGVDDPIYGPSDVSYDTLKSSYQGTGSWTHTFYTKA